MCEWICVCMRDHVYLSMWLCFLSRFSSETPHDGVCVVGAKHLSQESSRRPQTRDKPLSWKGRTHVANSTTSCRDACMACDDVADRVHLPLGHVEIVPFESIAESLTLGLQHEMQPFLEQRPGRVPCQSIVLVPEFRRPSRKSAETRSVLANEVFLTAALVIWMAYPTEVGL